MPSMHKDVPWLAPPPASAYSGPFRLNVQQLLRDYGTRVPLPGLRKITAWVVPLSQDTPGSRPLLLHVYEDRLQEAAPPVCDQCRNMGWQHHPVTNRRYHFIIPAAVVLADPLQLPSKVEARYAGRAITNTSHLAVEEKDADAPFNAPASVFDSATHHLHGLVHGNGRGHLLRMNARQAALAGPPAPSPPLPEKSGMLTPMTRRAAMPASAAQAEVVGNRASARRAASAVAAATAGSAAWPSNAAAPSPLACALPTSTLAGPHLMALWDGLCDLLCCCEISVEDVSNKGGMLLRLLHTAAFHVTWYGKWGYRFGRAPFCIDAATYDSAVATVCTAQLSTMQQALQGRRDMERLLRVFRTYSGLSGHVSTLSHLLQLLLYLVANPEAATTLQGDSSGSSSSNVWLPKGAHVQLLPGGVVPQAAPEGQRAALALNMEPCGLPSAGASSAGVVDSLAAVLTDPPSSAAMSAAGAVPHRLPQLAAQPARDEGELVCAAAPVVALAARPAAAPAGAGPTHSGSEAPVLGMPVLAASAGAQPASPAALQQIAVVAVPAGGLAPRDAAAKCSSQAGTGVASATHAMPGAAVAAAPAAAAPEPPLHAEAVAGRCMVPGAAPMPAAALTSTAPGGQPSCWHMDTDTAPSSSLPCPPSPGNAAMAAGQPLDAATAMEVDAGGMQGGVLDHGAPAAPTMECLQQADRPAAMAGGPDGLAGRAMPRDARGHPTSTAPGQQCSPVLASPFLSALAPPLALALPPSSMPAAPSMQPSCSGNAMQLSRLPPSGLDALPAHAASLTPPAQATAHFTAHHATLERPLDTAKSVGFAGAAVPPAQTSSAGLPADLSAAAPLVLLTADQAAMGQALQQTQATKLLQLAETLTQQPCGAPAAGVATPPLAAAGGWCAEAFPVLHAAAPDSHPRCAPCSVMGGEPAVGGLRGGLCGSAGGAPPAPPMRGLPAQHSVGAVPQPDAIQLITTPTGVACPTMQPLSGVQPAPSGAEQPEAAAAPWCGHPGVPPSAPPQRAAAAAAAAQMAPSPAGLRLAQPSCGGSAAAPAAAQPPALPSAAEPRAQACVTSPLALTTAHALPMTPPAPPAVAEATAVPLPAGGPATRPAGLPAGGTSVPPALPSAPGSAVRATPAPLRVAAGGAAIEGQLLPPASALMAGAPSKPSALASGALREQEPYVHGRHGREHASGTHISPVESGPTDATTVITATASAAHCPVRLGPCLPAVAAPGSLPWPLSTPSSKDGPVAAAPPVAAESPPASVDRKRTRCSEDSDVAGASGHCVTARGDPATANAATASDASANGRTDVAGAADAACRGGTGGRQGGPADALAAGTAGTASSPATGGTNAAATGTPDLDGAGGIDASPKHADRAEDDADNSKPVALADAGSTQPMTMAERLRLRKHDTGGCPALMDLRAKMKGLHMPVAPDDLPRSSWLQPFVLDPHRWPAKFSSDAMQKAMDGALLALRELCLGCWVPRQTVASVIELHYRDFAVSAYILQALSDVTLGPWAVLKFDTAPFPMPSAIRSRYQAAFYIRLELQQRLAPGEPSPPLPQYKVPFKEAPPRGAARKRASATGTCLPARALLATQPSEPCGEAHAATGGAPADRSAPCAGGADNATAWPQQGGGIGSRAQRSGQLGAVAAAAAGITAAVNPDRGGAATAAAAGCDGAAAVPGLQQQHALSTGSAASMPLAEAAAGATVVNSTAASFAHTPLPAAPLGVAVGAAAEELAATPVTTGTAGAAAAYPTAAPRTPSPLNERCQDNVRGVEPGPSVPAGGRARQEAGRKAAQAGRHAATLRKQDRLSRELLNLLTPVTRPPPSEGHPSAHQRKRLQEQEQLRQRRDSGAHAGPSSGRPPASSPPPSAGHRAPPAPSISARATRSLSKADALHAELVAMAASAAGATCAATAAGAGDGSVGGWKGCNRQPQAPPAVQSPAGAGQCAATQHDGKLGARGSITSTACDLHTAHQPTEVAGGAAATTKGAAAARPPVMPEPVPAAAGLADDTPAGVDASAPKVRGHPGTARQRASTAKRRAVQRQGGQAAMDADTGTLACHGAKREPDASAAGQPPEVAASAADAAQAATGTDTPGEVAVARCAPRSGPPVSEPKRRAVLGAASATPAEETEGGPLKGRTAEGSPSHAAGRALRGMAKKAAAGPGGPVPPGGRRPRRARASTAPVFTASETAVLHSLSGITKARAVKAFIHAAWLRQPLVPTSEGRAGACTAAGSSIATAGFGNRLPEDAASGGLSPGPQAPAPEAAVPRVPRAHTPAAVGSAGACLAPGPEPDRAVAAAAGGGSAGAAMGDAVAAGALGTTGQAVWMDPAMAAAHAHEVVHPPAAARPELAAGPAGPVPVAAGGTAEVPLAANLAAAAGAAPAGPIEWGPHAALCASEPTTQSSAAVLPPWADAASAAASVGLACAGVQLATSVAPEPCPAACVPATRSQADPAPPVAAPVAALVPCAGSVAPASPHTARLPASEKGRGPAGLPSATITAAGGSGATAAINAGPTSTAGAATIGQADVPSTGDSLAAASRELVACLVRAAMAASTRKRARRSTKPAPMSRGPVCAVLKGAASATTRFLAPTASVAAGNNATSMSRRSVRVRAPPATFHEDPGVERQHGTPRRSTACAGRLAPAAPDTFAGALRQHPSRQQRAAAEACVAADLLEGLPLSDPDFDVTAEGVADAMGGDAVGVARPFCFRSKTLAATPRLWQRTSLADADGGRWSHARTPAPQEDGADAVDADATDVAAGAPSGAAAQSAQRCMSVVCGGGAAQGPQAKWEQVKAEDVKAHDGGPPPGWGDHPVAWGASHRRAQNRRGATGRADPSDGAPATSSGFAPCTITSRAGGLPSSSGNTCAQPAAPLVGHADGDALDDGGCSTGPGTHSPLKWTARKAGRGGVSSRNALPHPPGSPTGAPTTFAVPGGAHAGAANGLAACWQGAHPDASRRTGAATSNTPQNACGCSTHGRPQDAGTAAARDQVLADLRHVYDVVLRATGAAKGSDAAAAGPLAASGLQPFCHSVQVVKDLKYFVKDYKGPLAHCAAATRPTAADVTVPFSRLALTPEVPDTTLSAVQQLSTGGCHVGSSSAGSASISSLSTLCIMVQVMLDEDPSVPSAASIPPPSSAAPAVARSSYCRPSGLRPLQQQQQQLRRQMAPPPEPLVLPRGTTVAQLRRAAGETLADVYRMFRGFTVTALHGLPVQDAGVDIEERQVASLLQDGATLGVSGCGWDTDPRWRHAGGTEDWHVACTCGTLDDDGERMIACDQCNTWMHTRCIGIGDDEGEPPSWVCPLCTKRPCLDKGEPDTTTP